EIAAEVKAEMRAKREKMSDEEKAFLDMPLDFSDVDTSGIEPRSTKDRFLDINANIQETLKESGYYDMPENKDKWHASVNLSELATLLRGELTFEQKQKLIKQFNVTAHLSENQEYITAKCTLGEQFLSLYAATKSDRSTGKCDAQFCQHQN
ncbi:MAG: hypothetical protein KDJ65_37445, partial [Anaerolineae bacterium]|nr:hypothetical protein [Anaerolineae bacterium]